MIIIKHWPYKWLCWFGFHEYTIGYKNIDPIEWEDEWECDVCGKRKPYVK